MMTSAPFTSLPKLRPNNQYLLEWMLRENRSSDFRALDYGCGDGALVFTARQQGIDAYGAETYYDGARPEDLELVRQHDPDSRYVHTITSGKMDFTDGFFDLIVANQVFEHIHDLEGTARELARILKPGGSIVSIFPIRSVIREPHLATPLIHRFPKGQFRRTYFKTWRKINRRAARVKWGEGEEAVDKAFWFMDTHTCYRNVRQIREIFEPLFATKFIEPNWLSYRLPSLSKVMWMPGAKTGATLFTRIAAGTVLLAVKR
jgi:2-polyprenyl-3-methyl-5-hydroxy-6-metoxy-1,4-benzoquinol methylase